MERALVEHMCRLSHLGAVIKGSCGVFKQKKVKAHTKQIFILVLF